VTATLRHADGREESVRCDWLIGCDGAHSTVRKKAGLEFAGEAEPNDWILADCRIDGIAPDEVSIILHTRGVLAFFPFMPTRCRIIADMGLARDLSRPADPSLAEVQAVVDERGPGNIRLSEPHWLAGFRIHERKVADYRRGRVFLAGDAAHIHSPAGGQGMNTGMQDTWNLAWKLALVQGGKGRPLLLDSYNVERGAIGEEVLRNAGRLTWMATLRHPVAQWLRNQVVGLVTRVPAVRRAIVRTLAEMTIHYPNSPLNGPGEDGGWARGGSRPGDRVPDTTLRDPRGGKDDRLLRILRGAAFHLLLLPAATDNTTLSALADMGQRVTAAYPGVVRVHLIVPAEELPAGTEGFESVWLDPAGSVRESIGASETALALLRPDGYLAYRGQPPSDAELRQDVDRYLIAQSK
jgi:hypothetical protein